ncbi:sensor histidine kinase, partial [Streptomyces zhihengii]
VDTLVFLAAAGVGVLAGQAVEQAGNAEAVVVVDQVVGAAACCALWVRRRFPTGLAVVLLIVAVVAPVASGAAMAALFSLAVHRPFKPVALVGGLAVVTNVAQPAVRPDPSVSYLVSAAAGVVLVLLMVGWGMLVRARRQLVAALRERAHRAETEASLRAEQAQRLAREAIAREMHDVLAHRLTLLSVHAGALEFRPDAPPAEVARAAGVIRDSAHEALQDLREIIGVLRAPGDGDGPDRPQPTLVTLDALVAESRQAGMTVVFDSAVAWGARAVPGSPVSCPGSGRATGRPRCSAGPPAPRPGAPPAAGGLSRAAPRWRAAARPGRAWGSRRNAAVRRSPRWWTGRCPGRGRSTRRARRSPGRPRRPAPRPRRRRPAAPR